VGDSASKTLPCLTRARHILPGPMRFPVEFGKPNVVIAESSALSLKK
jgi:hypothetical protein